MSDDADIRYMLDGGTRGMIDELVETRDAWGFGGSLWISKQSAHYIVAPAGTTSARVYELRAETLFEKTWFELDTGARGWAVWFHAPELPLQGRTLCGWMPPERESALTGWIAFLNDEIAKRVENGHRIASGSNEQPDRSFAQKTAFLQHLGIAVPDASNIDDLVTRLEEASSEGPIDRRSKTPAETVATDAWLSVRLGSGLWGTDQIRIGTSGRVAFEREAGNRRRRATAQLTEHGLRRLRDAVVESAFTTPPPRRPILPDSIIVDLVLESSGVDGRRITIAHQHALADHRIGPLVNIIDDLATYLRDPAGRVGPSDMIEILDEDPT